MQWQIKDVAGAQGENGGRLAEKAIFKCQTIWWGVGVRAGVWMQQVISQLSSGVSAAPVESLNCWKEAQM